MKSIIIVTGIFLFTSSGWTDVILETFEDENLDDWQELSQQNLEVEASWEVIDGELHGVNHHELIRLLTTKDEERLGAKRHVDDLSGFKSS